MRRLILLLLPLAVLSLPTPAHAGGLLSRLFHRRPAVAVLAPAPVVAYVPAVLEPATYRAVPTYPVYSTPMPSACPGGVCPKR